MSYIINLEGEIIVTVSLISLKLMYIDIFVFTHRGHFVFNEIVFYSS